MRALTKMRLIMVPLVLTVALGLGTFVDKHMVLLPVLCVAGFLFSTILIFKWNVERLRGGEPDDSATRPQRPVLVHFRIRKLRFAGSAGALARTEREARKLLLIR